MEENGNGVIDVLPQDLPGVTEVKPRDASVRIAGVVAEIRTENFQNINENITAISTISQRNRE
jgi:hypothetical protein